VPHGLVDFAIQDGALYALTDSMGLSFTKISGLKMKVLFLKKLQKLKKKHL